jgi:ankyrin repeat protein
MHYLSSPHPGDVEVARLLLEHGADPTAENIHKKTPLDVALNTNMGVARLLLEHTLNASVQLEDSLSQEANEHREGTQLLLEN